MPVVHLLTSVHHSLLTFMLEFQNLFSSCEVFASFSPFIFYSPSPPGRATTLRIANPPFILFSLQFALGGGEAALKFKLFCGFHRLTLNCKKYMVTNLSVLLALLQCTFQLNPHYNHEIIFVGEALFPPMSFQLFKNFFFEQSLEN